MDIVLYKHNKVDYYVYRLLYAVLPHWVANELRHKRQVAPMRFENVTILFSGLVGFSSVRTNFKYGGL